MIMSNDPWIPPYFSPTSTATTSTSFEDNFVNPNALPDSAEYIACLERKLERVKKGRGKLSQDLLKALEERRRDCIARLLAEDLTISSTENDDDLEEENLPTKWLKNYLNPEQPLTVGELVALIEADYLAKESDKIHNDSDTSVVVEIVSDANDRKNEEDEISLSSISQDLSVSEG